MPGPTSVIEAALLVGFVGRKEQTGHPSQKPVSVFEKLFLMTTEEGDLIFDPMSGSGTSGEAGRKLGCITILSDESKDYTRMAEKRLNVNRIIVKEESKKVLKAVKWAPISLEKKDLLLGKVKI
jgi:site-specific DNA-methyltransferase (adenine-specific)